MVFPWFSPRNPWSPAKRLQGLHLPHHLPQASGIIAQRQFLHREDTQLDFIHHVGAQIDRTKGSRSQLAFLEATEKSGGSGGMLEFPWNTNDGIIIYYNGSYVLYVLWCTIHVIRRLGNIMKILRSGIDLKSLFWDALVNAQKLPHPFIFGPQPTCLPHLRMYCIPLTTVYCSNIPFNLYTRIQSAHHQKLSQVITSPPWRSEHSNLYSKVRRLCYGAVQLQLPLHRPPHLQRRLFGWFPRGTCLVMGPSGLGWVNQWRAFIYQLCWRENHGIRILILSFKGDTHKWNSWFCYPWQKGFRSILSFSVSGSGCCLMIYHPCSLRISSRLPVPLSGASPSARVLQNGSDTWGLTWCICNTSTIINTSPGLLPPSFPITFNHKGPRLTQGLFAERAWAVPPIVQQNLCLFLGHSSGEGPVVMRIIQHQITAT